MSLIAAVQRFLAGTGTLEDALRALSSAIAPSSGGSSDHIRVYQTVLTDNVTSSTSLGTIVQTPAITFAEDRGALVTGNGNILVPANSVVRVGLALDGTPVQPRIYANNTASDLTIPYSVTTFFNVSAGDHTFATQWESVTGSDSSVLCSTFPSDYQAVITVQDTPVPAV